MSRTNSNQVDKPFVKIISYGNQKTVRVWKDGEATEEEHPNGDVREYALLENTFSLSNYIPVTKDSYKSTEYVRTSQTVRVYKNGQRHAKVRVDEVEPKEYVKLMHLYCLDKDGQIVKIDLTATGRVAFFSGVPSKKGEYPSFSILGFMDEPTEFGSYEPIFEKLDEKQTAKFEGKLTEKAINEASEKVDAYLAEIMQIES